MLCRWRVLEEKGLSKAQIESWEQPITGEAGASLACMSSLACRGRVSLLAVLLKCCCFHW
jgi:hypothetical protein